MSTIETTHDHNGQDLDHDQRAWKTPVAAAAAGPAVWIDTEYWGIPYYTAFVRLNWRMENPGRRDFVALYDHPPRDPNAYLTLQWQWAVNGARFTTNRAADGRPYWVAYISNNQIVATAPIHQGERPKDETARIGYYDLAGGVGALAQHTYAALTGPGGRPVRFGCYGGTDLNPGPNNVFPAHFYDPDILNFNPPPRGQTSPVALHAARAMASFSMAPEIRDIYDRRTGGTTGLGDCSGLVYAVMGVCHQMCNRVLWATAINQGFTFARVNWPPSMRASHALYGFAGVAGPLGTMQSALDLMKRVMYPGGEAGVAEAEAEILETWLRELRAHLRDGYTQEARAAALESMFRTAQGGEGLARYSSAEREGILGSDLQIHALKRELDHGLLQGTVAKQDYVATLNASFDSHLRRLSEVMPREGFDTVFGSPLPQDQKYGVVALDQMPDYGELWERLSR